MDSNGEVGTRTRGNRCTRVAFRYALVDRPLNGSGLIEHSHVVIGIETGQMPAGRIRHVEIIKNVGVLAEAEGVVPLIGESVWVIMVTVFLIFSGNGLGGV